MKFSSNESSKAKNELQQKVIFSHRKITFHCHLSYWAYASFSNKGIDRNDKSMCGDWNNEPERSQDGYQFKAESQNAKNERHGNVIFGRRKTTFHYTVVLHSCLLYA